VSPTVFATARGKSPALAFEFITGAAVDCARLSYQKTGTPTAFPRTGELRSSSSIFTKVSSTRQALQWGEGLCQAGFPAKGAIDRSPVVT
jgi:hypothetical protein